MSRRIRGERFDAAACAPDEWIMVVDTDRCIACGACELACRIEHRGPDQAASAIHPVAVGSGQARRMVCLPLSCRHCARPCDASSPQNFWTVCPSGEARASVEAFCDQCAERLEADQWPACATRCSMKTIFFGRPDDIAFVVREKRLNELGDVEITG